MSGHRCPQCGGSVTLGDGEHFSAPEARLTTDGKTTNGYLRDVPMHEERRKILDIWVGCNSCDWCGPRREAAIAEVQR